MGRSKIETFIGFSIRAGKYRLGVNAVATLKSAELLIMCHTASENTVKEIIKLSKKLHSDIIVYKTGNLEDLTGKENCKLMAITDKSLAKAIIDNLDENFIKYRMEEKNG